jgi:hypothetical protein
MSTKGMAVISADGRYRYLLTRWWARSSTPLTFVMLNPSTADAETDDPTIRRCISFAKREGFAGLQVVNLYAWRATKPADLWRAPDPVGPDNDSRLRIAFREAHEKGSPVVAAWGANAKPSRVSWVRSMPHADVLHHLGLTDKGAPRHPLYLRGDAPLTRMTTDTDHAARARTLLEGER